MAKAKTGNLGGRRQALGDSVDRWTARALVPARVGTAVTWTAAMVAAMEVQSRLSAEPDVVVFNHWMRRWNSAYLRTFGFDIRQEGTATTARRARLVVSNHRSFVDIAILHRLFNGRLLSRADIQDWPFIGWAARRQGTLFVDRENRSSGAKVVRQIRTQLRDEQTVILFPEGTTYRGDEVREFHKGAFVAVGRQEVEIVPVGIAYPAGLEWFEEDVKDHIGRFLSRTSTPVGLVVGKPYVLQGFTRETAENVRGRVQELVHQARTLIP